MGLRKMQEDLQKKKEQENSLITDLTTALEQSKADNNQLQQQLQEQQQENSSLKAELATAYKQIQTLNNSDLELQKAQQLKRSAEEQIETSKQLLSKQKSLQQQNKQKEKELQNSKEQLEKQKKELEERENSLQNIIADAKTKAQDNAAAALADGWKKLNKAKDAAEKEQDNERQHIKDMKAEAQKELESAQKAKAEAAEKGYKESLNNYTMVIRLVLIFAGVLGLIELIKHWYIINLYYDWYAEFKAVHGIVAAAAVAVISVGIFAGAYVIPWSECNKHEYCLGLAIRLMLLVWLVAMANNINAIFASDTGIAAAVAVIILSVVIAVCRWLLNKK